MPRSPSDAPAHAASGAGRPRARPRPHPPCGSCAPAFAILLVFFFLPTVFNFVYAFTDWSGVQDRDQPGRPGQLPATRSTTARCSARLRITLVYAVLVAVFQNLFGFGAGRAAGARHPAQPVRPGLLPHPGADVGARRRLHLPGAAQAGRRAQRDARRARRPRRAHPPGSATPPGPSWWSRSSTPGSGWACPC